MAYHSGPGYDDGYYGNVLRRCSACGFRNDIRRAPQGGTYAPPSVVDTTDSVTGKTFYVDNAASNGCAFCGCPLWASGGSLGDARR